jgi:Outer membrane lipoprotein-sorting protein
MDSTFDIKAPDRSPILNATIPAVAKRTMKNLQSGHTTVVTYVKADYNIGVDESLFSEQFLKQPPKEWIE